MGVIKETAKRHAPDQTNTLNGTLHSTIVIERLTPFLPFV